MRVHIHRLIRFNKKGQVFHTTPVENYVETVEKLIYQAFFTYTTCAKLKINTVKCGKVIL